MQCKVQNIRKGRALQALQVSDSHDAAGLQ
jgi:hypothetical protein